MIKKDIIYTLLALLLANCSATRHIPEGDRLYIGIKYVKFAEGDKYASGPTGKTAIEEVRHALDSAPNGSIAGSSTLRALPLGLWWYNSLYGTESKIGKWLFNTFATPPVLISNVNPELRAEVATDVLRYYGYFNGKVESHTIPDKRNNKKEWNGINFITR